jgi:hypothetical protein
VQELHHQIKVIQTTLQDEKQTNTSMGIKVGQCHATIETLNNDLNELKDRLSQVSTWWLLLLACNFQIPINQSTHENTGFGSLWASSLQMFRCWCVVCHLYMTAMISLTRTLVFSNVVGGVQVQQQQHTCQNNINIEQNTQRQLQNDLHRETEENNNHTDNNKSDHTAELLEQAAQKIVSLRPVIRSMVVYLFFAPVRLLNFPVHKDVQKDSNIQTLISDHSLFSFVFFCFLLFGTTFFFVQCFAIASGGIGTGRQPKETR